MQASSDIPCIWTICVPYSWVFFLCCFSSSSDQGVGFLFLTFISLVGVTKLRILSISWLRWLSASSSVVTCMMGLLLKFSQNLCIVFSLICLIYCPLILALGLVSVVSSIISLWSEMYGPAIALVGWKGPFSVLCNYDIQDLTSVVCWDFYMLS